MSNALYQEFVKNLAGKLTSEICVISLNFDCLLHEEFRENNVYREVYFDYLLNFNSVAPGRRSYNKKNGIPLIKLHGSLDWTFNPKTREINLSHWGIRPNTDYFTNFTEFEPYIFLPHQVEGGLMDQLWNRAGEELRQAQKITIIGYSFPSYDTGVISLFKNNIRQGVKLEIINSTSGFNIQDAIREQDVIKRYYETELFPGISQEFHFDGFEGYINRFSPMLT